MKESGLSEDNVRCLNNKWRAVLAAMDDIKLGGAGETVEVDETYFRKRKDNVGKRPMSELLAVQTVVAIETDPSTTRSTAKRLKAFIVTDKSAKSLIPNIISIVLPQTSIISDSLPTHKALESVPELSYRHRGVCNSGEFSRQDSSNNFVTTNFVLKKKCRALNLLLGYSTQCHKTLVAKIRWLVWRFNPRDHKDDLLFHFLTLLGLVTCV